MSKIQFEGIDGKNRFSHSLLKPIMFIFVKCDFSINSHMRRAIIRIDDPQINPNIGWDISIGNGCSATITKISYEICEETGHQLILVYTSFQENIKDSKDSCLFQDFIKNGN